MKEKPLILVPQIRSIEYFPPLITWINYLCSKGFHFVLMAHRIERSSFQFPEQITFVEITGKAYPLDLPGKISLKIKAAFCLWQVLRKYSFGLVWVCVWDFKYLRFLLNQCGFRGKVVYQFLELDPANFPFCKYADHIVVPEENRGWMTYFMAKLKERPWYLPNIPLVPDFGEVKVPAKLEKPVKEGKIIIFYSGLIDFYKRCLGELISAIGQLDDRFCLVIMPGRNPDASLTKRIETEAQKLGAEGRVILLDSMPAPSHLSVFRFASAGIGLYRPSSLNQVYAAPNRIYEFTAFGVPVVLPDFPQFVGLASKYPGGIITVDPENIGDIISKLKPLGEESFMEKARNGAARYFSENGHYEHFASAIARKIFGPDFDA
jgi:glycosyltransferase involved in cell wall biosynthesis